MDRVEKARASKGVPATTWLCSLNTKNNVYQLSQGSASCRKGEGNSNLSVPTEPAEEQHRPSTLHPPRVLHHHAGLLHDVIHLARRAMPCLDPRYGGGWVARSACFMGSKPKGKRGSIKHTELTGSSCTTLESMLPWFQSAPGARSWPARRLAPASPKLACDLLGWESGILASTTATSG